MPTREHPPTDHPITSGNDQLQTMREIGRTFSEYRGRYERDTNTNLISLTGRSPLFFENVENGFTDKFDMFSYLGILVERKAIPEVAKETVENTLQRIRY